MDKQKESKEKPSTNCPVCKKSMKAFLRHVRVKHTDKTLEQRVMEQMMMDVVPEETQEKKEVLKKNEDEVESKEIEKQSKKAVSKKRKPEKSSQSMMHQPKKRKTATASELDSLSSLEKMYTTGPDSEKELHKALAAFGLGEAEKKVSTIVRAIVEKVGDLPSPQEAGAAAAAATFPGTGALSFLNRGMEKLPGINLRKENKYLVRQKKLAIMIQFTKDAFDKQRRMEWFLACYLLCYSSFCLAEKKIINEMK